MDADYLLISQAARIIGRQGGLKHRNRPPEQRRAVSSKGGLGLVAASTCPWCGARNVLTANRRAHALICKERPPDADPGLYK